jgi:hypothetical protein
MRRSTKFVLAIGVMLLATLVAEVSKAENLPIVPGVESQPLVAQARRVVQALQMLGAPLTPEQRKGFEQATRVAEPAEAARLVQAGLDALCLAGVNINPESRVKVVPGPAKAQLVQGGWRVFLVKVHNEAGVTAALRVSSPHARPVQKRSTSKAEPPISIRPEDIGERWLDVALADDQPLNKTLSGLTAEYRILQLYSRDVGKREAKLMFDVGQGTQDLGFRNEINVLFDCLPAVEVSLEILDDDGRPTTASFVIRDEQGRVYPSRAKRLAPDFFFHDQIYRHSGEVVLLAPGKYHVAFGRGPEYRVLHRNIVIPEAKQHQETFRLVRWIKLADHGWYSGDHHVHAAGCSHYESPTEGVQPADMMRHILGEDLNVGCVLSWGPCWYHQKQFFEGAINPLSTAENLMRYDVEVSGFPSSHAGHLCLLRLKEDDYPGTTKIEEWPTWDLPVLKWGKEQGGVVGFSHSGWGLQVPGAKLPSYDMPRFDGIGANEFVVDVVHGACDFISAVDTPILWELSIWYHALNCGFTTRISGETDFPCIYGERVGLGRSYVKLDRGQPLKYDNWVAGLRDGRSYVSEGLGHLIDFKVNGLGVGESGEAKRPSVLAAKSGEPLKVSVRAAALLADEPREDIRQKPLDQKPYWHIERARLGQSQAVPVELIVNGLVVQTKELTADGKITDLAFDYTPRQSCWIALRIFPSAHTNPIFIEVDRRPIRASVRSAKWCLDAVDVCWAAKAPKIRESEKPAAEAAYETARHAYRKILAEAADR